jgi:two-component SAPR family response regulator
MAETSQDWNVYETLYKPLYEDLTQAINQLAKPLQLQEKAKKGRQVQTLTGNVTGTLSPTAVGAAAEIAYGMT